MCCDGNLLHTASLGYIKTRYACQTVYKYETLYIGLEGPS